MAQVESIDRGLKAAGAGLVYVAAQKRGGMFSPKKFLAEHPVSFPFLLDEARAVTKAYGLYHRLGKDAINIAHPATLVIGRDRVVRFIYRGENQADRAPIESFMEAVRKAQE